MEALRKSVVGNSGTSTLGGGSSSGLTGSDRTLQRRVSQASIASSQGSEQQPRRTESRGGFGGLVRRGSQALSTFFGVDDAAADRQQRLQQQRLQQRNREGVVEGGIRRVSSIRRVNSSSNLRRENSSRLGRQTGSPVSRRVSVSLFSFLSLFPSFLL